MIQITIGCPGSLATWGNDKHKGQVMVKPKEIYPSSYKCKCGHVSDFFESTIGEMKAMSMKKEV